MSAEANGGPLGNIPDLRDVMKPVPDTTAEGKAFAEVKVGLRCAGCGERIHKGFEFVRLQVMKDPVSRERSVLKSTTHSCARPECDYALRCGADATAVRKIDNDWLFMDDERLAGMFNDASAS